MAGDKKTGLRGRSYAPLNANGRPINPQKAKYVHYSRVPVMSKYIYIYNTSMHRPDEMPPSKSKISPPPIDAAIGA